MNHDDMHHDEASPSSDEFWGSTPDWSDATPRPRRARSESHGDITGAIKNLWSSAMSGGAGGTREHRVLDANAPRPNDETPVVGPTMFDDLDTEIPLWESNQVAATRGASSANEMSPTGAVPIVDAAGPPPDGYDDMGYDDAAFDDTDLIDEDGFAAMTPVPLVERDDNRRGAGGMKGGIDPLLVRIGAAAIVTTLLVPFAIGWTSDDSDDTITSAADPAMAQADASTATAESSTVATEPDASVALDAESLPPAVVVNPAPSAESSTSSSAEADATANASATSAQVEDCAIDYEVEFGDFWVRLADGAGVTLTELLDANGATTDTALFPGTTICLPAGATTPPPPSSSTTAAPTTAAPTTEAPTTAAPTTAAPTTAAPTTEAPTTAAPTTDSAPAPAPEPAGPEDIKQIIRDVWPDELEDRAIQIAYRESRFVPTAKNYCCYGLFQMYWSVHQSWLSDLGITDDQQLYDPATNARAAYALYQRAGGWGPWSMTAY